MSDIVIVSAARTPVGSFNGSFSDMSAADLGSIAIKEAINRAKIKTSDVSEVIMGQVLTASCGQNPARQASINAGIPNEVTALTINQVCFLKKPKRSHIYYRIKTHLIGLTMKLYQRSLNRWVFICQIIL